jgi:hypothetical protein
MAIPNMPEDFVIRWHGNHFSISGTCTRAHHMDALATAILAFRSALPSGREAVADDFGLGRTLPILPSQKGGLARAARRQSERTGA